METSTATRELDEETFLGRNRFPILLGLYALETAIIVLSTIALYVILIYKSRRRPINRYLLHWYLAMGLYCTTYTIFTFHLVYEGEYVECMFSVVANVAEVSSASFTLVIVFNYWLRHSTRISCLRRGADFVIMSLWSAMSILFIVFMVRCVDEHLLVVTTLGWMFDAVQMLTFVVFVALLVSEQCRCRDAEFGNSDAKLRSVVVAIVSSDAVPMVVSRIVYHLGEAFPLGAQFDNVCVTVIFPVALELLSPAVLTLVLFRIDKQFNATALQLTHLGRNVVQVPVEPDDEVVEAVRYGNGSVCAIGHTNN